MASESESAANTRAPATGGTGSRPIFLCYRQVDGKRHSRWIFSALQQALLERGEPQDIYFDQAAPATTDWHAVHGPALERARGIVVICTPGLYSDQGRGDWVHRELDWWLAHRSAAPIIVDVTGEATRWVPHKLMRRWPNAQRVNLDPDLWGSSTPEEAATVKRQVASQILGGIAASEISVVNQDLERSRTLNRRLIISASGLLLVTLALVLVALYAILEAKRSKEQQILATANRLVTQAEITLGQDSNRIQLAGLLAIEAIKRYGSGGGAPLPEATHVLQRVLDMLPSQAAHLQIAKREPWSLAYSKDGRFVAAASPGAVRLWGTKDFRVVADLSIPSTSFATTLAFVNDDRYLIAVTSDGNRVAVYCWEVPAGKLSSHVTLSKEGWRLGHQTIAVGALNGHVAWPREDGEIDVLEAPALQSVARLPGADSQLRKLRFDPSERYVAELSGDSVVWIWDRSRLSMPRAIASRSEIVDFTFGPGARLLTVSKEGVVSSWDPATGKETAKTEPRTGVTLVEDPPGNTIVAWAPRGGLRLLELPALALANRIELMGEIGSGVAAFSPRGNALALTGGTYAQGDRATRVWDLGSLREIARITEGFWLGQRVSFSPDGHLLATSTMDGVRVWDIRRHLDRTNLVHGGRVWALDFSPDGRQIATASDDGTARVWNVADGHEVLKLHHAKGVVRVAFSPDGQSVATGSYDGFAQISGIGAKSKPLRLEHSDHVYGLAWMSDSKRLVTAAGSSAVIWDAITGQRVHTLSHKGRLEGGCLAVSARGTYLATRDEDEVVIWDGATGSEVRRLPHEGGLAVQTFSADGRYLVTSELDRVHVWKTETWERHTLPFSVAERAVAFNPASTLVALGSLQGLAVFDVATGKKLHSLSNGQQVMDVAFSHDGKHLASASWDRVARVWDTKTFREQARLVHDTELWGIAFSPDNKHVATNGMSSVARVWLFQPADVVAEACARLTRNMSYSEWQEFVGIEPFSATCVAIPLDPVEVAAEAAAFAAAGDRRRARARFGEAARIAVEARNASGSDAVCLSGSTWGSPDAVLAACDLAVAVDPENVRYRDSRGIARALLHDDRGAIEDFTVYIAAGAPAFVPERRRWIEMLRAGKNPLDEATLERLRSE